MRRIIMSVMMGLVVLAWSGMARAQVADVAADVAVNAAVNANNGMQFHNGRRWYWAPNNNHWMVYHDNQWFAPGADGSYRYPNGQTLWGNPVPYSTGYRGSYYGNNYYGNGYSNGYYGNGYYGNGYGNGYYGNGYGNAYYGNGYGNGYGGYGYGNRGANVGAAIGGALGGNQGAGIGAAIGGAVGRR